jgi:cellulose synthase/poly-beta-1,6-N-acetylglucosamine synthase-like glycosyltransferase
MGQVDAIIPGYAEPSESLARTVDAVLNQDLRVTRTVVVDDASPTPLTLADELTAWVELLRVPQNVGVAAARNIAAATSRAEFLLFVNCDVAPRSQWLTRAVAFMDSHPSTGAVGGVIVPTLGSQLLRRWRLRFLENPEQRTKEQRRVTWLTGHATLIRRSAFEAIGGYDPRRRFTEDHELCGRLRARGYEIHHLPTLVAESYEFPSIDLFARKALRHSGWTLEAEVDAADLRPIRPLPATVSVLRTFVNHSGRNLGKLRLAFLPVDVAVAVRSFILVWETRCGMLARVALTLSRP